MLIATLIVAGHILAAFFSGSETALVSVNWIRLEHWIEKGRAGALALEKFVADPSRLLGTTLVGTNIAIIMTSSLVSWAFAHSLEGWSPGAVGLLSTFAVTLTLLVFGEIIPKVVGRRLTDVVTLRIVHPLRFFYGLFFPVIWVVTGLSRLLMRPLGVRSATWRRRLTKDQLRLLLTSEGEKSGAVDEQETKLISGIFEFALTTVEEVMVPRTDIIGLSHGSTVGDACELVRIHGFSRLPVLSTDREMIDGMIHSRDLLGVPRDEPISTMVRSLPHVPETKTCDELFRELQARRQHMAVIVDEHGTLAGIVTLEDLLEELVGEIEDEYDARESLIRQIDEGLFMIDGRAEIDSVEDALGVDLPEGDYNTIAGLVLQALGRIPEPGDETVVSGLELRVVSASATRVGKVRVRKRWAAKRSGHHQ
ncbi:MAG: hemolysin family protein [Candidatus Eisenbacteria bacterium]